MVGMYTEAPQNLPEPLRSEVRKSLEGQVLHCVDAVGARISAARRRRDEAVRAALVATAATTTLRTEDVRSILACVSYSKKNQVRTRFLSGSYQQALTFAPAAAGNPDTYDLYPSVYCKHHWFSGSISVCALHT